ncbi:MAG: hypothetical protein II037_07930, partial [Bacteroidales bacterium]|nr:hypothetical protein [Bacteroidales bacterium]
MSIKNRVILSVVIVALVAGFMLAGILIGKSCSNTTRDNTTTIADDTTTETVDTTTEIENTTTNTTTETEEPTTVWSDGTTEADIPIEPVTGVIDVDPTTAKTMYTITNVNVRMGPSLDDMIVTTLYTGKDIQVCEIGNDEWAVVILDEQYYYINKNFISDTPPATEPPATLAPTVAPTQPSTTPPTTTVNKSDSFHYYGIYTSQYWHFTPEQIDAQWAGYKSYKPALPNGTTRAWQAYLY